MLPSMAGVMVEVDGCRAVVTISGEVDVAITPELDQAVEDLTVAEIEIDLRDVTFMSSSGLASILRAKRHADTTGSTLRLRAPSRQVRELLDMTQLTKVFTIVEA
jgi:anti-anti-sigma factor